MNDSVDEWDRMDGWKNEGWTQYILNVKWKVGILGSKSYLFIYHVLIQQVCIKMTNCNDILYIKTLNKSYPIYIYI